MKILIGLIEHMGDVVACEPVARFLRHKHPEAHIAWAIRKPFRELIDSNPYIDETIVLGCLTDWIKFERHRGPQYDFLVDLHVNYRVCEECRVPLVKERGNPFVNAWEWFDYGALLEAFSLGAGLPKLSAQPRVYLSNDDKLAVDGLGLPSDFCVIHRESNNPIKDWLQSQWLSLVRFLLQDLKIPVVEVGVTKNNAASPSQDINAQTELAQWTAMVPSLLDRTSILQTAEVIRRARFFIGVDSGPAHLANAVQTPGIVLLGRVNVFRQYTPFTGFYAGLAPDVRIVRNLTGPVAEINAKEVIEATGYLVNRLKQRSSSAGNSRKESASPAGFHPPDPAYRRMVEETGFFDRAWYLTHASSLPEAGIDPLDHFLAIGAPAICSPGPGFNATWYRSQRPDLATVADPLRHYLHHGLGEGLRPRPDADPTVRETPAPAEQIVATLSSQSGPSLSQTSFLNNDDVHLPRVFAFYLPQFHPIAENNFGHRPGFTEWDNVIRAKPLFKGHYQPKIPGELGYYDLRSIEVMRDQIRLANSHGISGFCFYYYYFQGKKLLYKPIQNYIQSDIKAPFFFLWANENWSRRWDGGDQEIIIAQDHSPDDDIAFIRDLLPTFTDPRYVKIGGKPILAIYKTHLFPNVQQSAERWRTETERYGFPGLYLVMVDDWKDHPQQPRELGFDASYEIPSNIVPANLLVPQTEGRTPGLKDSFAGRIVDYHKFASFHMGRPLPDYKRFRTVMAPWDNTARYGSRAMIHINTETDAYKLWLSEALLDTKRRFDSEEQIVFLHSWNEWCEGTYVEPDGREGRRRLEQTRQVIEELRALAALDANGDHLKLAVFLSRLMREKDEGASRSLAAMRQQNMYLYREIGQLKGQIAQLAEASQNAAIDAAKSTESKAESTLQEVLNSKSWRATAPLRALARLVGRG